MEEVQQLNTGGCRRRMTIAGSFGFGNAGDEGAPLAMQDMARSIGIDLVCDALGRFDEPSARSVIGLGADDTERRRQLMNQPLLYVGGGIVEPQDKAAVSRIGAWASQHNVPYTVLFGAAVEPRVRYGWRSRRRLNADLRRVSRLFVRDVISATELSRLMPMADIETIGDVVLWLEAGTRPQELDGIDEYIAVNLAPRWSDELGWRQWIAAQLMRLTSELKMPLVFVPCTQHFDRDQDEHDAVARLLADSNCAQPIIRLDGTYSPRTIAAAFGSATLTVGMRLHACVLSYAQEVPWVGLTYHPKLSGFAATVEQPARLLPHDLPALQSQDVYGFTFSSLEMADCDLVRAAREALGESSFHRLDPLKADLAAAFRMVLEESATAAEGIAQSEIG